MEVKHPNTPDPSPEELQQLQKLKTSIQRAIASGSLTRQQRDDLTAAIRADNKVTPAEVALIRMVQDKVWKGEIRIED